ncbi:atrial natriuretic peptide receptor 1 isoform X5 [Vidua macroura]|uniref:atrial natriuretic peptide receptor 1 isoform X5 n=1 Tax=Vidua macroura TaxID=187451 RepID=UPI0023A8E6F2|nr:atrial natriuretic peptide receptor 1 isoform X5 [Vidua macroura]
MITALCVTSGGGEQGLSPAAGRGGEATLRPWAMLAVLAPLLAPLLALVPGAVTAPAPLTLAVVLPQHNLTYPWAWPRVGPAVRLAAAAVNSRRDLLPGFTLGWVFGNSEDRHGVCSEMAAPLVAVDLRLAHHPAAFLGPGCVYSAAPVARFTSHWQLPLVTAGAEAHGFDDKSEEFGLTTRAGPSHRKLGELGVQLHRRFNWTRRALLVYWDERVDDRPYYFAAEGLYVQLPTLRNLTVMDVVFRDGGNFSFIIQEIKAKGRIVYVCCAPDTLRELMLQAEHEGLTGGDFAFFYIDTFGASLQGQRFPEPRRPWHRGDPHDARARRAFQAVTIITYKEPENPEYQPFLERLKEEARDHFNFSMKDGLMNFIAAAFHDGVLLYAQALNETLERGGSVSDASAITRQMWNRTFYGVTGFLKIDEQGDRESDYSLWDMDPEQGNFQIVANYNGTTKKIQMVPGREIHWPGNAVPSDVPPCGFEDTDSQCGKVASLSTLEILSLVVSLILAAITVTSFFIYRKLQLEKELAAELWRVRWEDLQMSSLEKHLRSAGSKLTLSLRGSNYGSLMTAEGQFQVYAKTAYYKGNLVAVKHVNRKRIELTRKVRFELKHMRDVQNEHLTRFVGACTDPPNICILTEYCPRGSLQDILENESITLDWMFRYSLTHDIVKGMQFLHNGVIVSHGNLKSSNCVVDSRFVLKITDYGLESFRVAPDSDDTHALFARDRPAQRRLLRGGDGPQPQRDHRAGEERGAAQLPALGQRRLSPGGAGAADAALLGRGRPGAPRLQPDQGPAPQVQQGEQHQHPGQPPVPHGAIRQQPGGAGGGAHPGLPGGEAQGRGPALPDPAPLGGGAAQAGGDGAGRGVRQRHHLLQRHRGVHGAVGPEHPHAGGDAAQ